MRSWSFAASACRYAAPWALLGLAFSQQPSYYDSLLTSAQQAQARGEFETAARFYQQASTLHPEIAELKANLGLMYYQADKSEEAAEAFRQSIQLNPELFVPNLFLGLDYVKMKRFKEAIPYLKHAVQSNPNDVHAQVGLGQAFAGVGDTRLAIRSYRAGARIDPGNADVWYRLGVGYLEQVEADARILMARHKDCEFLQALMAETFAERGDFIQAGDSYRKLLSSTAFPRGTHADYAFVLLSQHDLPGAERELESELAADPGSLAARLGLARLEMEQRSIEQAAEQIAQIWNTDAGFLTLNVQRFKTSLVLENRTELLNALSKLQAKRELSEEAVSLFRDTAANAPIAGGSRSDTVPSHTSNEVRGDASQLYSKGAYRQCSDLLISRFPTLSSKDLGLLALCSYSTGAYQHAFEAAETQSSSAATEAEGLYWETKSSQKLAAEALAHASEIDSSSPRFHVLLGDIYRQQRHPSEAEREYRKALSLRPQDSGALFGLSLALLADGQVDQALQIAQTALKDNPGDPELNAVMGEILCQREDFSEAETFLRNSLNTKPEYVSQVHALLGKVYANTNRTQEAIAELKLALPEDKNGHIYYQIGRLYLKLGDRDSAQRAFLRSKRLERESLNRPVLDFDLDQGDSDSR